MGRGAAVGLVTHCSWQSGVSITSVGLAAPTSEDGLGAHRRPVCRRPARKVTEALKCDASIKVGFLVGSHLSLGTREKDSHPL